MNSLDWTVLIAYFGVMVAIGVWSHKRVDNVGDYFTAGGKMPWWLSGISHHMSGYSAVMFTGYAGIAYTYGVTSYVTWSLPIAVGIAIGAKLFAPRLNRMRSQLHVASPLEYLKDRYNLPTQQALAWSGVLLKIVDVGAKWAAIATLLSVFTGVTITQGIIITGAITAVYCTVGGLWADALTELGQFVIQLVAGVAMLVAALNKVGGISGIWNVWDEPALHNHGHPTAGPYTTVFLVAYLFIKTFEYNGGMWNQAQRYMATGSAKEATRSAMLSSALWFIWPLVLFFPMWISPLLVTAKKPDGSDSYGLMVEQLMPHGLLGLIVVGFFSHTMAMCSSDANAIAAVVTRDIAPAFSRTAREWTARVGLIAARFTTLAFLGLSMAVATQVNSPTFKDIITVVIKWVAGLIGPIAIPFMLGLMRAFRKSGPTAALVSWAMGLFAFYLINYPINDAVSGGVNLEYQVSLPLAVSLVLYILIGFIKPEDTPERDALIAKVNTDPDSGAAAVSLPEPTEAPEASKASGTAEAPEPTKASETPEETVLRPSAAE